MLVNLIWLQFVCNRLRNTVTLQQVFFLSFRRSAYNRLQAALCCVSCSLSSAVLLCTRKCFCLYSLPSGEEREKERESGGGVNEVFVLERETKRAWQDLAWVHTAENQNTFSRHACLVCFTFETLRKSVFTFVYPFWGHACLTSRSCHLAFNCWTARRERGLKRGRDLFRGHVKLSEQEGGKKKKKQNLSLHWYIFLWQHFVWRTEDIIHVWLTSGLHKDHLHIWQHEFMLPLFIFKSAQGEGCHWFPV